MLPNERKKAFFLDKKWPKKLIVVGVGAALLGRTLKTRVKRKRLEVGDEIIVKLIPTVMIHGTFGTRQSLGGMIRRYQKKKQGEKILEVVVEKNGQVNFFGNRVLKDEEGSPLIQLIFKDNHAPEWQQADWLKEVLSLLKQQFQIGTVNLLGHSSGGVTGLRYLLEYGQRKDLPVVKKLVVIGAPFNGEIVSAKGRTVYDLGPTGPLNETDSYRYFSAYKQAIPRSLQVLNIFSDLGNGSRSDGVISVDSAKSLRFLIKKQVAYYQEKQLYGLKKQHSLLHESQKVDQIVAEFLWRKDV